MASPDLLEEVVGCVHTVESAVLVVTVAVLGVKVSTVAVRVVEAVAM